MVINLIKYVFVPIIVIFVAISSLLLDKAPMVIPLLLSGCLLAASIMLDAKFPKLRCTHFVFLGMFHWFGHLNWAQLLYFICILFAVHQKPRLRASLIIAVLYMLEYTAIRLSYQPITTYNLLVSVYDFLAGILVISLFRYVLHAEQEKKRLREQTDYLSTHDALTGLLNYHGYIRNMEELVRRRERFILITMDFQDFQSYNTESVHRGNEILIEMSVKLKQLFRDAVVMSRYAGDRFALAVPQRTDRLAEIDHLLDVNQLGFQVTCSVTQFPQHARTATSLFTMAEDRLFHNKRNVWLLREDLRFQEEKLRVVGELAAGMAHEIRNPLTTIRGFMQISKKNDYVMKPWFDLIMSEISRMNELTAEFLQFAKPHISNVKPELIQSCIDRVLFLTESDAALRGHLLHTDVIQEPLHVLVDRDKMVQVLLNLVRNAFESMTDPGVVRVRLTREAESCIVEIADNGSGISETDRGKIFNPFYTTKENGTGLGLSICQKIVQDHGGSLEVSSVVGEGSAFTIRLPVLTDSQNLPSVT